MHGVLVGSYIEAQHCFSHSILFSNAEAAVTFFFQIKLKLRKSGGAAGGGGGNGGQLVGASTMTKERETFFPTAKKKPEPDQTAVTANPLPFLT